MSRYFNLISAALVIALSSALWTSRRQSAELSTELAQSTESFVAGIRVPAVPLQSAARVTRLDSLCDGHGPMLVYFHRRDCPACARLDPAWKELGEMPDVSLHQVHLDGLPPEAEPSARGVSHWSASSVSVVREARVQMVPAVLAVGRDCDVKAAGAGAVSAAMVIRRFATEASR